MPHHGATARRAHPVIAALILVLLAVPTVVWVIVRMRPKMSRPSPRQASEGPKHRWWQP
jgi:flagellar biogenesis protein FliO